MLNNKKINKMDSFLEIGKGYNGNAVVEETMTIPLPKDETIYSNNNKDYPFLDDKIAERIIKRLNRKESLEYLEKRKNELLKVTDFEPDSILEEKEFKDIQKEIKIINIKLDNYKITNRFEILDL